MTVAPSPSAVMLQNPVNHLRGKTNVHDRRSARCSRRFYKHKPTACNAWQNRQYNIAVAHIDFSSASFANSSALPQRKPVRKKIVRRFTMGQSTACTPAQATKGLRTHSHTGSNRPHTRMPPPLLVPQWSRHDEPVYCAQLSQSPQKPARDGGAVE